MIVPETTVISPAPSVKPPLKLQVPAPVNVILSSEPSVTAEPNVNVPVEADMVEVPVVENVTVPEIVNVKVPAAIVDVFEAPV